MGIKFENSRFIHRRLLIAGVSAVAAIVIVGAFGLRMLPLSGEATSGRIAFVSDRDGDNEIYVMDADGTGVVQLTENDSDDRDPVWSPDGSRIALASDRDNDVESDDIYVMNADGTGVIQLDGRLQQRFARVVARRRSYLVHIPQRHLCDERGRHRCGSADGGRPGDLRGAVHLVA